MPTSILGGIAQDSNLTTLNAKIPAKGAATTANSTPVNIASDQTVPTSIAGSVAITNSGITSIDTKTPAKGSATSANSSPVVIASDQTVPTSLKQNITTGQSLSTAVNSAVTVSLGDAATVNLFINPGGTGAGVITFEVSMDGTTWVTVPGLATQISMSTGVLVTTSSALVTGTPLSYVFNVVGWSQFRARVSTLLGSAATLAYGLSTVPVILQNLVSATVNSGLSVTSNVLPASSSITSHTLAAAATTNATSAKNSAGSLMELEVSNITASPVYLKLYNKASAPTVGTDVPVAIIPVAAGAYFVQEYGSLGSRFTTGIAYAITLANTVADTTAVAVANTVFVKMSYY